MKLTSSPLRAVDPRTHRFRHGTGTRYAVLSCGQIRKTTKDRAEAAEWAKNYLAWELFGPRVSCVPGIARWSWLNSSEDSLATRAGFWLPATRWDVTAQTDGWVRLTGLPV